MPCSLVEPIEQPCLNCTVRLLLKGALYSKASSKGAMAIKRMPYWRAIRPHNPLLLQSGDMSRPLVIIIIIRGKPI